MFEFDEACRGQVVTPVRKVVEDTVTLAVPALKVVAARVGAKEHTAGLERGVQLAQHARQLAARHVEQRGVGEDPAEVAGGQVEFEKVLLPHLAAALGARHLREAPGAVEADRTMTEAREGLEVASRPAAEIEYREGR